MNGLLLVDKPRGMTSHDVCYRLRKILLTPQIGHTGTLDPMAEGVMVVCVGRATKLAKYFSDHEKTYTTEVTLGYSTDTLDSTGTITQTVSVPFLDSTLIDAAIQSFLGKQKQIPPQYSAIKINGKKLYELARENHSPLELEARDVIFYALNRISSVEYRDGKATFRLDMHVSKGTYVRSFVRDLGERLGYPAVMSALNRTSVGTFSLQNAQKLAELTLENACIIDPLPYLGMTYLTISPLMEKQVDNGVFLPLDLFPSLDGTILQNGAGKPLAIYEYDDALRIMRLSVKF